MIYGFRRMIYLLRKHGIISVPSYANGIYHRTIVRYHIEDISPVPAGTDIIEKRQVSVETCRFSWQREKDSNPHIRSQSPLCYHYTIPLCSLTNKIYYTDFTPFVNTYFHIF